jgi:hypothetical protein
MRPDDHHVEPLFSGLGHETKSAERPGRRDGGAKWRLLAFLAGLVVLACVLYWQAF